MKNRKRMGGILRLLFFLCILFAVFAGVRVAAVKILSRRAETKTAEEAPLSETDSASVSSVPDYTPTTSSTASAAQAEMAALQTDDQADDQADGSETGSAISLSDAEGATLAAAEAEEKPAPDHMATELENGRAYLLSLEQRTPVEMEYMIEEARKEHEIEVRRQEYQKKRDAYLEELKGNALWEAFDDFVFLGDSRVVGFDVFGLLPSDRILADAGDTINSITDRMDRVRELSPKYIFISYGINDIGIGFWPTKEEYTAAFAEKIHALQKELPDAEIYVNSIIPAREDAEQMIPVWAGLPEYSEAVRQMCEKENIPFIDNDRIVSEHGDLYAADGVHLQRDFYRYWAENQLLGIFDHDNGLLTF